MTADGEVNDTLAHQLRAELAGTFTIERELRGGMSRVFVAFDSVLRRRVAIKVLPPELSASLSVERFHREILVAASLQHPNIVPVLSAGEFGGIPYFIMPYVDGESLRSRLGRGPLSVRETVNIMRDIVRALEHAHQRGIVHRDIKPDNVILTTGAATVTDFGVAKALAAARARPAGAPSTPASTPTFGVTITTAGLVIGTPAYMAPEQIAGDPNIDHRADIYALGVVGYELLGGAPPFHGRSAHAIMSGHLSETPPPIQTRRYDVTPALADLIAKCLQKAPADRYRSAADVGRALDAPEITSGSFSAPPRSAQASARRFFALAAGVTIVAIAIMIGLVLRDRATNPAREPVTVTSVAMEPFAGAVTRADSTFTGGVADILARGLTRASGMRVVTNATAAAVGDSAFHVQGGLRRDGESLRLTLRLIDPAGVMKWTDVYDAKRGNGFAVQDSIATRALADLTQAIAGATTRHK